MTELTPEAKDLLAAAREGDEPTAEDESRNHRALLAAITAGGAATTAASAGTASAAATGGGATAAVGTVAASAGVGGATAVGLGGGAKLALATLLVVGAVGGGSAVVYELNSEADAPSETSVDAQEPHEDVAPIIDLNATDPNAVAIDEPETNDLEPLGELEPTAPPIDAVESSSAPIVRPRPARVVSHPTVDEAPPAETPTAPPADPLAEEAALLRRAEAARSRGDAATALAALDEHRQRFGNGQLTRDRHVTRVLVLCDLGRVAEASTLGRRLVERYPNTPLAARVQNSCAGGTQ